MVFKCERCFHLSSSTVYILEYQEGLCHPNGHTTSIRRRYYVDSSKTKFRQIFTSFRVLFRCNFDGWKIHVVSTYLFPRNFIGRKVHVVSTYFFDVISMIKICSLFLLNIFDVTLMSRSSTSFLVNCKLMKIFEKGFPVFVTFNSWPLQEFSL